jgi:hypothetical protein
MEDEMAKNMENEPVGLDGGEPDEMVFSLIHDAETGEVKQVQFRRVEFLRPLLGIDPATSDAEVMAIWQAQQAENAAEANRQNQRNADLRAAAGRLREVDAGALTAIIATVKDGPTRTALAAIAELLADLRTVIRDGRA